MIRSFLCKTMKFLSLSDRGCNVSLTNLALYVIMFKIATSDFSWTAAVTLIPVLLNYMDKRRVNHKAESSDKKQESLAALKGEIESIKEISDSATRSVDSFKSVIDSVQKTAEQTKELINTATISTNIFSSKR